MKFDWFNSFRRNREETHEAIFDLDQGVVAERRAADALRDLAEVGRQKLETISRIEKDTQRFEEEGGELAAEAARAYREGLAALLSMPLHLFPSEPEARLEAMNRPSDGSTSSRPSSTNGLPGGSSPRALPNEASGSPPESGHHRQPRGEDEPPRRRRGRPKGSRNHRPNPTPGPDADEPSN